MDTRCRQSSHCVVNAPVQQLSQPQRSVGHPNSSLAAISQTHLLTPLMQQHDIAEKRGHVTRSRKPHDALPDLTSTSSP